MIKNMLQLVSQAIGEFNCALTFGASSNLTLQLIVYYTGLPIGSQYILNAHLVQISF